MKLSNILSVPFALVADVVTLGNMGDRSFTQQVFDKDARQQRFEDEVKAAEVAIRLLRAAKGE